MHVMKETMDNMTNGPNTYTEPVDRVIEGGNITDELVLSSTVKKNNTVINSSVMFSVGVLSNLLALIVIKRSPTDQKRKLFYRLVAGLTLTDLTGLVGTSPIVISVYVNDFKWIGGTPLCKYFGFMMIFSGLATTTIVCLMAVERLLCIRHPYLYYARLRKKHATYFLVSAWIFAATLASLPLMGFGDIVLQYPFTWCFMDYYSDNSINRAYNYVFALFELLTIAVTVSCNGIVLYTLFRTKMRGLHRKASMGDSRTFSGYSRRYAECQMAVLLIGITVVFSSCYLPLMVRIVINQTKLMPIDTRTDLLMIRLASMNQILDPWVYILLRRELVWRVVQTVKSFFTGKSKYENGNSKFRRQESTVVLMNDVQYTCCAFCFHCLCDPPQRRRPNSLFSVYSDYRHPSLYSTPSSPTNKLAMGVIQNMVPPDAIIESSRPERLSQVIDDLKQQASLELDVISQQPNVEARIDIYSNGKLGDTIIDNEICDTLLEADDTNDLSSDSGNESAIVANDIQRQPRGQVSRHKFQRQLIK